MDQDTRNPPSDPTAGFVELIGCRFFSLGTSESQSKPRTVPYPHFTPRLTSVQEGLFCGPLACQATSSVCRWDGRIFPEVGGDDEG